MKTLYNKSPRTSNFYMLPKIHNPATQEDLLLMELEALQRKWQHM